MIVADGQRTSGEVRTPFYCAHPFYGFVCRPNSELDFSDTVPDGFGHGAIATIGPEGFRNSRTVESKPADEVWIALLGGSVAFSSASTSNATTISGYLERDLNAHRGSNRRRVRVWNFALPAAQQPQQAAILMLHAADLDGVITFDGINEAIIAPYYNKRRIPDQFPFRPIYEILYGRTLTAEHAALTWAIEETENWRRHRSWVTRFAVNTIASRRIAALRRRLQGLGDLSDGFMSSFPSGDPTEPVGRWIDAGIGRWKDMIVAMNAIATARRIDATFVLQPVPERDKSLTPDERSRVEQFPDMVDLRMSAYPGLQDAVRVLAAADIDCADFRGVFADETAEIYTDHIHFEDRGCAIVAKRLAAHVLDRWKSLR
jgi:hypothetical protein